MRKHKRFILLTLFILSFGLLSGCSKNNSVSTTTKENNDTLCIAVSIVPEETFVKAVGKDLVNVVTMIPSGQNPENFQPTPQLLENFSKAKLYFSIGVPTESVSILPKVKDFNSDVKIVNLEKIVKDHYPDREFAPNMRDPHIWLSPKRVKVMINSIKDELCTLDSKNKSFYEKNAKEYINKLDKMDKTIKSSLENLPNKAVIVYHPSLGYFCDDYGLEMISLEKEGKESTPKDLQATINYAKQKNVKTIFYQAEVDNRQCEAFAEEINGTSELVAPLAPDYINNLQKICSTLKKSLTSN